MDLFPLPIFPVGSLASSVITTVWIGVLVVSFFNLRLGWVLSGLVVPGYLAPLIIAKPWAATAVIIEGVVTYLLVWLYSERLMRWSGLAGFFGRDRFFALVLGSILVRILFDGWLFPLLGDWANETFRLQFDYRNNLHSFGLIIVSLIANQFWKTGLIRGLPPFVIILAATWFITRYGLMELTNFSISNLTYMYEDVATSMLASPKSYIILITAAFIASRMNLLYGWDYNGILIPSLLALLWYQPDKILVSFIEALVVLGLSILALRLPFYQGVTMEGARKLMLFFNVSFAWKLVLGYALVHLYPELKVTDYFGFGYMLTTLMAIKMHDKEIVARLSRATLQTSLVAVAGATVAGFALTFIAIPLSWSVIQPLKDSTPPPPSTQNSLIEFVREKKLQLYQGRREQLLIPPLPAEADLFTEGVRHMRDYILNQDAEALNQARQLFSRINYHISTLEDHYLVLEEGGPQRGWGTYLFNTQPQSRVVLEVPAPLSEWGALETAAWILVNSGGRAMAIAGSARLAQADGSSDVLRNRQAPFQLFHREMSGSEVIQVRALEGEALRALTGVRDPDATEPGRLSDGQVWVRGTLSEGVDWVALQQLAPALQFRWEQTPLINIQREQSHASFTELFLLAPAMRRILLRAMQAESSPQQLVEERRIDGYLQQWLFNAKDAIAVRGSNLYQPPTFGDLLYWDSEIITPLIAAAEQHYHAGEWGQAGLETLQAINAAAARYGYGVTRYRHRGSGSDFLILAQSDNGERHYWGSYVLRLGAAQGYLVQTPRPLYEGASFEFGVHLFESLQAQWLLIGGTHPDANSDGSADLINTRTPHHLFNLVNQVILREAGLTPMLALQCRVFSQRPNQPLSPTDMLIAFQQGIREETHLPPLGRNLMFHLQQQALQLRFVDGTQGSSGYEVGLLPQANYLDATRNKEFAVLWLSPTAKRGFRQQQQNRLQDARLEALGIESHSGELGVALAPFTLGSTLSLPDELRHAIVALQEYGDIIPLSRVLPRHPSITLRRLIDVNSAQSFMLVSNQQQQLLLIANLDPPKPELHIPIHPGPDYQATIQRFIDSRAALLEPQP